MESKLMLSAEEQLLVNNTQWILTKRIIIEKAMHMFGTLSLQMQPVIERESGWLPEPVVRSTPKIARGENYLELPYVMLDYPRCFDAGNIFAVRTMFWWGNFFSITLQLSGAYKKMFQDKILNNLFSTKLELFICIHEDQWHHHFGSENYIPVKHVPDNEIEGIIASKPFVKLAVHFPLHEWDHVLTRLDGSFAALLEMLKDQLPRR